MTARERAEQLLTDLIQLVATDGGYFNDTERARAVAMAALADERRRVWRDVWNEVARIQGNGSPMTDFGKGVIAATKDVQTFICEQSQAHAEQEG